MKCLHCQGEMKKGETPFHIDRKNCHLKACGKNSSRAKSGWVRLERNHRNVYWDT